MREVTDMYTPFLDTVEPKLSFRGFRETDPK